MANGRVDTQFSCCLYEAIECAMVAEVFHSGTENTKKFGDLWSNPDREDRLRAKIPSKLRLDS